MLDQEMIIAEVLNELSKERDRLESLGKDKAKLPAKVDIVISSCALLARADGEISPEELYRLRKGFLKRFCINEAVFLKYIPIIHGWVNLPDLKKTIEENNIDKNFLSDLYDELRDFFKGEEELSPGEQEIFSKIFYIFDIPVKETEEEPDDVGEDDSAGYEGSGYYNDDEEAYEAEGEESN